jgi:uncharacterized repeat protein (TIGR01451 family)
MIPGAVVEYCIAVANAAGSATATNISVSDTLPAATTYLAAFGIKVNGTVTGAPATPTAPAAALRQRHRQRNAERHRRRRHPDLVFRVTVN